MMTTETRLRGRYFRGGGDKTIVRTSLLLLESQVLPVDLHAVTQSHPEIGLLLERHALPSLLDVGEGRVGDGVSRRSSGGQGGRAAHQALAQQVGGRGAQHGGRIRSRDGGQTERRGGGSSIDVVSGSGRRGSSRCSRRRMGLLRKEFEHPAIVRPCPLSGRGSAGRVVA